MLKVNAESAEGKEGKEGMEGGKEDAGVGEALTASNSGAAARASKEVSLCSLQDQADQSRYGFLSLAEGSRLVRGMMCFKAGWSDGIGLQAAGAEAGRGVPRG